MSADFVAIWNRCLSVIRKEVEEQSFKTWFLPIQPVACNKSLLTIQVPSQFFYEWLEEHYVAVLRKALMTVLGPDAKLEYSVVVDKGSAQKGKPFVTKLPASAGNRTIENGGSSLNTSIKNPFELRPLAVEHPDSLPVGRYTFENFVEGDCNRLARNAGLAISDKPGLTSFNPLFIYGSTGLGKTHIAHAIGNRIKQSFPEKTVLCVSADRFANQYYDALRHQGIQELYHYYMQADVLVVDDVQFFASKEKTQELFFNIFNFLHQAGKQIIMTSDRSPKEMVGLNERLLSRFKWGLSADLQQPDFETKMAIILNKVKTEGIEMPENVIEYLAYSVNSHIRDLEGILITLVAQSLLNRKEIDLELAKETIQSLVHNIDSDVNIDYIQKCVAEKFKVTPDDLKSKVRKMEIVIPRQISMFLAKKMISTISLKEIGFHFGKRDHSTVIHSISSVENMMEMNPKIKTDIEDLQRKIKLKAV